MIGSPIGPDPHPSGIALSVVVPTLNEVENLRHVVRRIGRALKRVPHEIVVVDDASTDGTAMLADELAVELPTVCALHRRETRGLSASIVDGLRASRGSCLAVIDADLQHGPEVLPRLLEGLAKWDLVIGSRFVPGARISGWSGARRAMSRAAAWLTRAALGLSVSDPLSGLFAMRRSAFERVDPHLRPRGWKILLEILALDPGLSHAELPIVFRPRCRGATKMSWRVTADWLASLWDLRRRRTM